jgi:hypothetical protein
MHNFVLACPSCNRSKSDSLAAKVHLDGWLQAVTKNSDAITQIGETVGVVANLETSLSITKWSYGAASGGQANGWIKAGEYDQINGLNK